ncbi:MAG: hypothetical protein LC135_07355 [Phycisphaerae bacterium]|nr:hypothetical protein [Phycisphaerae bacterium]MCZ2399669.1 hypothetical protein [Phycisphaerae bacterium]
MLNGLLLALAAMSDPSDRPEALRRAIGYREALFAAHLEVQLTSYPEPSGEAPETYFITFRAAGDRYLMIHRGDADGCVIDEGQKDGRPNVTPRTFAPRHALYIDGQVWQASDAEAAARLTPPDMALFDACDLRQLALNPAVYNRSVDDLERTAGALGAPLRYTAGREGSLEVVTAVTGDIRLRWWIDPDRNWNVVRSEVESGGADGLLSRHEVELGLIDGLWFPRRVAHVVVRGGQARTVKVCEVLGGELNRPELPGVLEPDFIGIEPGREVQVISSPQKAEVRFWDGARLIDTAEYVARVRDGSLVPGPGVKRTMARIRASNAQRLAREQAGLEPATLSAAIENMRRYGTNRRGAGLRPFESEWEAYTRRFIETYRLDEEQRQRAWSICDECQERGREYIERRRSELRALDAEGLGLQELPKDVQPARAQQLNERRARLLEPLQRIFDAQLRPRLDKLPTRAQRAAAEARRTPQDAPAVPKAAPAGGP